MSSLSQFGGGSIKSIQRGVIASSAASATTTISSVNTAKSILMHLGSTYNVVSGDTYLTLTNSTTITATKGDGGNISSTSWQLVEYY